MRNSKLLVILMQNEIDEDRDKCSSNQNITLFDLISSANAGYIDGARVECTCLVMHSYVH